MNTAGDDKAGGIDDPERRKEAHEESIAAAQELARKVEQAESMEGEPVPSQEDADETTATGI